ncbi:MAG TPA: sulfatase [Anaerolineales bacterium]|nr:sulfatase [Anaerolineales bacterium]
MDRKRPNIVFLVLDTHRADRLGAFGCDRATSPNIDRFARGATVFEQAVSPGQWTIPAHASMFTGEFPTTHLVVQSASALDPRFQTIAERLKRDGYATAGFCNNPLVGVLNNGLRRGFDRFYNYGGAIPTLPERRVTGLRSVLQQAWNRYTQFLRKISYPVQNWIAQSDRFFQLILNPFIVPFWARFAHFKGDTGASLLDAEAYLREHAVPGGKPQFVFINLMGTHLPYSPPAAFVERFAPRVREDRAARDFVRTYNTQAVRWFIPMAEPFTAIEYEALSQMYDAEVAHQDAQLESLLRTLDDPHHRANTMVVIVADHGEMLGEHQVMGHGLGVYEELIHVPLILRYPGQEAGRLVPDRISTTYLFQTILDALGYKTYATCYAAEIDIASQSLLPLAKGQHKAPKPVFSEAYPPQHVIKTLLSHDRSLLERFHSDRINWAAFEAGYKLQRIEDILERVYDLATDPLEFTLDENPQRLRDLGRQLDDFIARMTARRPNNLTGAPAGNAQIDDEKLVQRLRGLGYLE